MMTMKKYSRVAGVFALVLAMAVCGGCVSRASYKFYALRSAGGDNVPQARQQAASVAVKPVILPGYLLRPQIVTRDGVELKLSDYNRWGEALDVNVTRVLRENLATLLADEAVSVCPAGGAGRSDYELNVYFDRFEYEDGKVFLKAAWRVHPTGADDGDKARGGHVNYSRNCPDASYEQIALQLSELLGMLSEEMAASIKTHP